MSYKKRRVSTFLAIGGIVVAIILINFLFQHTSSSGEKTLDGLLKSTIHGQIVDVDGSIGVKSVEDIHYRWEDDKVTIYFGNITMDFKDKEIADANVQAKLQGVGLNFVGQHLFYNGEEVPY